MILTVANGAGSALQKISVMEHFPLSIQHLIELLQQNSNTTPRHVKYCIEQAHVSPEDLIPWADFNHPVTDSYGRKLVFHGGYFEIMVMSWMSGDFSAIHDHGGAEWGAVQCFGQADHYIYMVEKNTIKTLKSKPYTPGIIHTVTHDLIHQMGNPGDTPFLSLHVYGCTQNQTSITGNARIFDLLEEAIQYTDGGVFFCLPEHLINQRELGLKGDRPTTLRHHQQMRDRLQRILSIHPSPTLEAKLQKLDESLGAIEFNTN